MCSMSREPRRFECTICTAVAPEDVFTVRTYGATSTPYDPKRATISAQIHATSAASPQVNAPQPERPLPTDKSQDRGRRRSLSEEQVTELRQRAGAGAAKATLAREFGISRETVYQYLRTTR